MRSKNEEWQEKLTQARQQLVSLLQTLQPAQWEQMVFSENTSWTINTIVSHLVESERGMSIQVHKTRKGEPTIPDGFDLDRWNAGLSKRMEKLSPADLLAALATTRVKTLAVLASIRDEEWVLRGRHPSRGEITIEQYYETIVAHDFMHAQDIRATLG